LTTKTLKLPRLYAKQRAAIFSQARYAIIEASTKSGKTVGCMVWILSQAWENGKDGRNWWWVAPTFPVAKIAYRRIRRMLTRADPSKSIWTANDTELWIGLASGAVIWFKGADNTDSLYGEEVHGAVIDESTRCKEEAWHAVRSTLTHTRGPVRIIGNTKGRKNWAYKLGQQAQQGDKAMSYSRLTAYDAVEGGIMSLEEIEDAKRVLPENVFRELYLAEPSDDGGNPFGCQFIAACVVPAMSTKPPKAFGVDLAKSNDWVSVKGLDEDGNLCRDERWQGPWRETIEKIKAIVGKVPTLVDATGVGDPVVEELQRQSKNITGFKFTGVSKQPLMELLAVVIQSRQTSYPDGNLRRELDSYEYVYTRTGVTYSAPPGLHDDDVCAFALAHKQLKDLGKRSTFRVLEFDADKPKQPETGRRLQSAFGARGWN